MSNVLMCPSCGSPMVRRTARQGPTAGNPFWGCSRFPACRETRPLETKSAAPPATTAGATFRTTPIRAAHAEWDPAQPTDEWIARATHYYIGCVEAEGLNELVIPRSVQQRYAVVAGATEQLLTHPDVDWRCITSEEAGLRWAQRHLLAGQSERSLYGYPVVTGHRDDDEVVAPLFYVEVEIRTVDDGVEVRPLRAQPELNHYALRLLGLDRAELADATARVESAASQGTAEAAFQLRLAALGDVVGLPDSFLDPGNVSLVPLPAARGITHTALLFTGERAVVTRQLLTDLEDLLNLDRSVSGR